MTNANDRRMRLPGTKAHAQLLEMVEARMDLGAWGFELAYAKPGQGFVIYDSPRCRVMFRLSRERDGDEVGVAYGRSHAPNEGSTVEWNGYQCMAWHNLTSLNVIEFIEGLSAQEVVERQHARLHGLAETAFLDTEVGRTLRGAQQRVALEAFTWTTYGARLFSLFDLREPPQPWEALRQFVRRYYELRPELSIAGATRIPEWQIC